MSDYLEHYGTPRHSGRYPWGSGDNPYQRSSAFLKYVREQEAAGRSRVDIAKDLGYHGRKELDQKYSAATNIVKKNDIAYAIKLKEHGYSNTEIGRKMGINESTVRGYLAPGRMKKLAFNDEIAEILKDNVSSKKYIDVGKGIELQMGITRNRLDQVVANLVETGEYEKQYHKFTQLGTGKQTDMIVLVPKGTPWSEVHNNMDQIGVIVDRYDPAIDKFRTSTGILPPKSLDSSRIKIRYAEEGGKDKDGVIELRRGVEDISLGESQYAQVRIAVDGKYYLKGMAMYAEKMPEGVDVIFNTNKHEGTPMMAGKDGVLKPLKDNPDNPFGATILPTGQRMYKDANGKEQQSVINKVSDEGTWEQWTKTLSSQMLSKQPEALIKQQLRLTLNEKKEEFESIMALTNPIIKKELLKEFSDNCDHSAETLKAAALPRQQAQVILPISSLKDDEIYAPNFENGERVVLIRYPHAGRFEIPELTVNNNNKEAKTVMQNARDAVGINANVAARLSGADFDGDAVTVIPNNNHAIKTRSQLKGLENFDPHDSYPKYTGMKVMLESEKQKQMGVVSNLINDMTLKGADDNELARAVRHSMVVIDAVKHELDYRKSYLDNDIDGLKQKYQDQGDKYGGAATLISRAKSKVYVPERKLNYDFDPDTGEKKYVETGRTYLPYKKDKETGEWKPVLKRGEHIPILATEESTQMRETKDAFTLSSGTPPEQIYASFANACKSLANEARKAYMHTEKYTYDKTAAITYKEEVKSLEAKVNLAKANAPYERQAQLAATAQYNMKKDSNNYTKAELKRLKGQELAGARLRMGAKKEAVVITDKEWQAIEAHAINSTKLSEIVAHADKNMLKQLATPKEMKNAMTPSRVALAISMANSGYTTSEIASRFGVSTSTINKAIHGK